MNVRLMGVMKNKTEIETLTREIKKLNTNFSFRNSFIRGIVSGFGTAIGAGLLVALAAVILGKLTGLPVLGQFITFIAGHLSGIKWKIEPCIYFGKLQRSYTPTISNPIRFCFFDLLYTRVYADVVETHTVEYHHQYSKGYIVSSRFLLLIEFLRDVLFQHSAIFQTGMRLQE